VGLAEPNLMDGAHIVKKSYPVAAAIARARPMPPYSIPARYKRQRPTNPKKGGTPTSPKDPTMKAVPLTGKRELNPWWSRVIDPPEPFSAMPSDPNSNTLNKAWLIAPIKSACQTRPGANQHTHQQVAHIVDRRKCQHAFKIALSQCQQCSTEHRS